MSQENINLTVLGLDIAFKPSADLERVRRAITLVEERYEEQKRKYPGGQQARDLLLIFMALGLADELLQARQGNADMQAGISALLAMIEKSI